MLTDFILSNLLGIVSLCCIIGLFLWVNSKITVYTDTLNNLHNDENKRLSALETFLQRGILLDTQDKIAQKYAIEEIDDDDNNSDVKDMKDMKDMKDNKSNNNSEVFNKCIENEFDKLINDSIIDVNDNIFKINIENENISDSNFNNSKKDETYNQDNKDNNGTESLNVNVNSMPLKIKLKSKSK